MKNKYFLCLIIRIMDLTLAITTLVIFLPVLLIISLLLIFTGEKKVFYFQKRLGKQKKPFKLIKFVTMYEHSESYGAGELTLPNDSRILPVGKYLRKTKLNELPQLINIVLGDMSIVGPRPQTEKFYRCFDKEDAEIIATLKPGLTGIGSIVFRNEEAIFENVSDPCLWDEKVIMPYKGKLERWYSDNMSLNMYIKLIMLTSITLAFPRQENYQKWFKSLPLPEEKLNHKIREYL